MKKIIDLEQLNTLLNKFQLLKGGFSNNYLVKDEYIKLLNEDKLYYLSTSSNLCILVKKSTCYRLYYIINDPKELFKIDSEGNYAIEILFRGGSYPVEHIRYWQDNGFKIHLQRDMYEAKIVMPFDYQLSNNIQIDNRISREDAICIKTLFDSYFDKYTGDFLTDLELDAIIQNKEMYVAYVNNKPVGGLHYYLKNKVMWLGHIAVDASILNQGIARNLLYKWINENCASVNRFALWVQSQNDTAIHLYKTFGFKYLNKSTISMLKLKEI